jgi:predicted transport protein
MDQSTQTMIENLKKNTGKSLEEWVALVHKTKLEKHGEIVKFLKEKHNFGHGYANLVAMMAREPEVLSKPDDSLVEAQYKGKETLRPIYEAILQYAQTLGKDVEVAPKKTSVSFRRKRQFALVQPSTKTRIDLGLKFNNKPHAGRLETSGPFGAMCTHRVQLTDVKQVDKQLMDWIKDAYAEAG